MVILLASYVTCEIQGQLGNQMFQVAAATAYALDHGYEARFPLLKKAIHGDLNLQYVFHRVNSSDFPPDTKFLDYSESATTPFHDLGHALCLHGYFCHDKYFSHHMETIEALFAPTEEIVDQIYKKYGALLKGPTVAVHVRTFFPDGFDPNNGIGRENWNYFLKAIEYFPEDYSILIFSDSPQWIKEHFPLDFRPNIHVIEGNPHYFDFYLMSLCNHQVISPKSTFSWWAALLNPHRDKVVIRPDDGWLEDRAFPESWIKMSIE